MLANLILDGKLVADGTPAEIKQALAFQRLQVDGKLLLDDASATVTKGRTESLLQELNDNAEKRGETVWIYRDHRYGLEDGEWFLHGLFG